RGAPAGLHLEAALGEHVGKLGRQRGGTVLHPVPARLAEQVERRERPGSGRAGRQAEIEAARVPVEFRGERILVRVLQRAEAEEARLEVLYALAFHVQA